MGRAQARNDSATPATKVHRRQPLATAGHSRVRMAYASRFRRRMRTSLPITMGARSGEELGHPPLRHKGPISLAADIHLDEGQGAAGPEHRALHDDGGVTRSGREPGDIEIRGD